MYVVSKEKFFEDRWRVVKVGLIGLTVVELVGWSWVVAVWGVYSWRVTRFFRSFFLIEQVLFVLLFGFFFFFNGLSFGFLGRPSSIYFYFDLSNHCKNQRCSSLFACFSSVFHVYWVFSF